MISDISKFALDSAHYWEKLFGVQIDGKLVCKSYEMPLKDNSTDLIFTFQSFHHFGKYEKTLKEIYRVLRSGGIALFLYEPSCPNYIYSLAKKRVNRKRPDVPEDVLKFKEIKKISKQTGFDEIIIDFDANIINRQPVPTVYYYFLQKIPFLKYLLPCTANYILKK